MTTTAVAPTNIAILKYWGMEDEELALPTKSSISFTVEGLTTTTTLDASPKKGASAAVSPMAA